MSDDKSCAVDQMLKCFDNPVEIVIDVTFANSYMIFAEYSLANSYNDRRSLTSPRPPPPPICKAQFVQLEMSQGFHSNKSALKLVALLQLNFLPQMPI